MPKHETARAAQSGMSDEVLADRVERAVWHNWSALERDTLMLQAAERLRHTTTRQGLAEGEDDEQVPREPSDLS